MTFTNRSLWSKTFKVFLGLFLTGATTSAALAATEGHHGVSSLLFYVINFSVYVIGLYFLTRKTLAQVWSTRREVIELAVNKGERELSSAKEQLAAAEAKLQTLETETARIRESFTAATKQEVTQLITEAHHKAESLINQARAKIAAETRATQDAVRKEVLSEVFAKAENLVRNNISSESDQSRRMASFKASQQLMN